MNALHKYPRTRHLEGSRLQAGDEDLKAVPLSALRGAHVVIEEKIDGANAALSFDAEGELWLQSRGHFLSGGGRERHFALFKTWAHTHRLALREALGARYVLYGEWVHAKHTIYYDALPHLFLEFDLLDKQTGAFLSTPERARVLAGAPVVSVPVLHEGAAPSLRGLEQLIAPSRYKSPDWAERLLETAAAEGLDPERVRRETDPSPLAEGLYLKHEQDGRVLGRYKFVRASFLAAVLDSESHWLTRPILPNALAPGVELFGAGA